MTDVRLKTQIEKAFEDRATINAATRGHARDAVEEALDLLDRGKARVAEKLPGATGPNSWKVNQWLKKAVLLSFRLNDNVLIDGGPGQATWWDKVPSKLEGWGENRFKDAGFRAVPGANCLRGGVLDAVGKRDGASGLAVDADEDHAGGAAAGWRAWVFAGCGKFHAALGEEFLAANCY